MYELANILAHKKKTFFREDVREDCLSTLSLTARTHGKLNSAIEYLSENDTFRESVLACFDH